MGHPLVRSWSFAGIPLASDWHQSDEIESSGMKKEIATRKPLSVTFRLLGPVEAYADDHQVDLGTKRERCLLAALISAAGQPVSRHELAEWIWDDVPDNAPQALYEVTSDLRRRLAMAGLAHTLSCKDGWTKLAIPGDWVDVHQFGVLTRQARSGQDDEKYELLGRALELRRGEPLAGLDGRRVEGYRDRLITECRTTDILFNQVAIKLGHGQGQLTDLDHLFRAQPADSRVAGLYMYALHQAGAKAMAIAVYQEHKDSLAEHGTPVPPLLRSLYSGIHRNADVSAEAREILGGQPTRSSAPNASAQEHEPADGLDEAPAASAGAPAEPGRQSGGIQFNGPIHHMRDVVQGPQTNYYGVGRGVS
jgi:DNA-binding SARP family transcriptional activator